MADDHSHCDHHHDHGHGLDHCHHGHSHAPKDFGLAFALGTALNFSFVLVEVGFGFAANSMALLADAGHNLSDVFGLVMAWGASALAKRQPTARFTYGLRSSSILAALANAIFLLVATGAIILEALQRFFTPEPVAGRTVMIVAAIGILINGFTAWLFMAGRKDDLNVRAAYLHMAGDAAISFGVVIAGAVMLASGLQWIDPVVSIVIAALIVWGTWGLLRESIASALHAVPPSIDPAAVRRHLESLPGVAAIHDLHIWPMSTTETALTCHIVMPSGHPGDRFTADAAHSLLDKFKISHSTIQIELGEEPECALKPDHVV